MLLNEPDADFEGGDFELIQSSLNSPEKINLSRGKIIVFPSFLFHRVTPVLKGIRKSIVIWTLGPKFR
jgi:PKHD-type hydroxylase